MYGLFSMITGAIMLGSILCLLGDGELAAKISGVAQMVSAVSLYFLIVFLIDCEYNTLAHECTQNRMAG